jgi:hypothetical protein
MSRLSADGMLAPMEYLKTIAQRSGGLAEYPSGWLAENPQGHRCSREPYELENAAADAIF